VPHCAADKGKTSIVEAAPEYHPKLIGLKNNPKAPVRRFF
jgi:hypothetical protein